jgi:outer membrane receptor protein involved in Fe transport
VRVSMWANNIFDRHYLAYAADVSSFDQDQTHFGEPRTFGGSIAMKF